MGAERGADEKGVVGGSRASLKTAKGVSGWGGRLVRRMSGRFFRVGGEGAFAAGEGERDAGGVGGAEEGGAPEGRAGDEASGGREEAVAVAGRSGGGEESGPARNEGRGVPGPPRGAGVTWRRALPRWSSVSARARYRLC